MARRYYSSIAAQTTLSAGVDSTTATIPVTAVSGWPSSFPYTLLIDKDTVNEEIVTVTGRTGTTLTVTRGVDGSSGIAHSAGANVQHGVSARDFDETNTFINGTGVVTSAMIADGAIVDADVNATAAIAQSKVATLVTDLAAKFPLLVATNEETGSYTLVLGDAQGVVEMNVATANTLTIPPNSSVAYPIGTSILVVQTGAGQTTITAGAGVTINSYLGLKIIGQWAGCTLIKRATDTWVAVGGLVA
tara:strand:+ start:3221 stop:3961 length:741 start_codon:yes stop_codon:yes gene_type:complete